MTVASNLANLSAWLDKSSQPFRTPCSTRAPKRNFFNQPIPYPVEMVVIGRYAEILPWDFSTPPTSDFDAHALPLFVSHEQAAALNLPPVADLSPPNGQGRAFDRLTQIVGKMEDALMTLPAPWRAHGDWRDRLCAIVGIPSPDMPIADAVDAAGASGVDLDAFPLLAVPTWHLTAKERANLRLPFLPS